MTPDLRKVALAAALGALMCASLGQPAPAAIETDPFALYQTMRKAYDAGSAKGWPFGNEVFYQTTVLDAGRAYSLFRPTDSQYAELAALTVDVTTELHYNPLTNNDAAMWYVLESANYEARNGDQAHQSEGSALVQRLNGIADNPPLLAKSAEADALADVEEFHKDGDSVVQLIVTDVRAYNLTHDPAYRSALLQHAADPAAPLARVPDPEYGEMFSIATSALTDPGFNEADQGAARIIKYRRDHTPELKVIARVESIPHELRLTRTAPADEYFGNLKYSPLGVHNELVRINKYLDKGWGFRMEGDALQVDSAVEDWQHQYPHDTTLPPVLLDVYQLLDRVHTDNTMEAGKRVKTLLLVQYPSSRQAQELASPADAQASSRS